MEVVNKQGGAGEKKRKENIKVSEAKTILCDQMQAALDEEDVTKFAIDDVEQNGIVFIDEIDKICSLVITVVLTLAPKGSKICYLSSKGPLYLRNTVT